MTILGRFRIDSSAEIDRGRLPINLAVLAGSNSTSCLTSCLILSDLLEDGRTRVSIESMEDGAL